MKKIKIVLVLAVSGISLAGSGQETSLTKYVNPLIGTAKMGHTFPGATVPFGMVQLSPETDSLPYSVDGHYNPDVYKYCAGYQYSDQTITGFSHTHFSGTGHSDLGDFLVMASTGSVQTNPGTADHPETGYRSRFRHETEVARPGYYAVELDDYKIKAEMTASERVGFHRYTFPATEEANIILDLQAGIYNYPDKNIWTVVRVENDSTITGYRQTNGWARTRVVYFAMKFSKPFKSYGSVDNSKREPYRGFWGKFNQRSNFPDVAGKQIAMFFRFNTAAAEKLEVKMALSGVSIDGALENLQTEVPGWNFDAVAKAADTKWEKELERVKINAPEETMKNFYTAMYHAFIAPNVFMDQDHTYRGLDYRDHKAEGFSNYTTFSLWDTYRALHPLYTLLQTKRNADMVNSMLAHYDESALHMLPIWSHYANDNWCMSGYHSVAVLADAVIKGTAGIDPKRALAACVATARRKSYEGIGAYVEYGYLPAEISGVSVSNTLEYAYDDWAIAQLAKYAGDSAVYNEFIARAGNYKNVFDKDGFAKKRNKDGSFAETDLLSTHGQGFIEGNSWNYSFFVPQDPAALIKIMGGEKSFRQRLDSLFTMYFPDKYFAETEDITREGIMGTYVHGNEPAHHVAYLYNFAGQPWKTQEMIRKILAHQYQAAPDGLGGNDDCGQMSAWYIFSALGFYPVAPASGFYSTGSPIVDEATLQLENGKQLHITVKNQGADHPYVKSIRLNGKSVTNNQLSHAALVEGGELEFTMSAKH